MSLGLGIFLMAVGAILVFAVNITVEWVDLRMVGYILLAAGFVVVILGIALMARKRRSITRSGVDRTTGERVDYAERDDTL
ncbi:hypothetical protein GCM10027416_13280 [Okibacterium endophyticum]